MTTMTTFDYLIVGQGLAGTALAWSLTWRHRNILVVDRSRPSSASRVAAGLITPITGQRLTPTWRYNEFWPAAVEFYRRVERVTSRRFFEPRASLRLFSTATERDRFANQPRKLNAQNIAIDDPSIDHSMFRAPYGGFSMAPAAQLDTKSYLDASRDHFSAANRYQQMHLDLQHDIRHEGQWLTVPRLGIRTRSVVFCQGIGAVSNPWFRNIAFEPAKGEMLEVRIPELTLPTTIHQRIWLTPQSGNRYLVGATYDRGCADDLTTPCSRVELSRKLRMLLRRPFHVLGQRAAVRPAVVGRHPILGRHRDHQNLAFFNGLGSKGVLQSPYLALHFSRVLDNADQIDPTVDLANRAS